MEPSIEEDSMIDQPTTAMTQEELDLDQLETGKQLAACIGMFLQHPVPERWGLMLLWGHRHMGAYAASSPQTRTVCLDYCPCRPARNGAELRACCNCGSGLPHHEAPPQCVNCGGGHTWAQCAYRADDFRPAPGPMHVKPCPWNFPEEIEKGMATHLTGLNFPREVCSCQWNGLYAGEALAASTTGDLKATGPAHLRDCPWWGLAENWTHGMRPSQLCICQGEEPFPEMREALTGMAQLATALIATHPGYTMEDSQAEETPAAGPRHAPGCPWWGHVENYSTRLVISDPCLCRELGVYRALPGPAHATGCPWWGPPETVIPTPSKGCICAAREASEKPGSTRRN